MSDSFGDLAESCAHRKPRQLRFGLTHSQLGRKPTPNSYRVHNSARRKNEIPAAISRGFIKCTPNTCRELVFAPCGDVIPAAVRRRFRLDFKPGSYRNRKSTEMRSWQSGGCNKAVKVTAIPERGCDFQNHRSVRARPLFLPNGGLLMWQRAKHYIRSAGAPLASKSSFSHWGCCQPRKSAPRPRRGSKFFMLLAEHGAHDFEGCNTPSASARWLAKC